jgi:hypothetical protein
MKIFSVNEIKKELEKRDSAELLSFCMRLIKFKKENKELLSFLLFESADIATYINNVKQETDDAFDKINKTNIYFIKKSVRKILRTLNRHIRFISLREAEAELLIHFCNCFPLYSIPVNQSRQLSNLYLAQIKKIDAAISALHPDLQYDLRRQIKKYF